MMKNAFLMLLAAILHVPSIAAQDESDAKAPSQPLAVIHFQIEGRGGVFTGAVTRVRESDSVLVWTHFPRVGTVELKNVRGPRIDGPFGCSARIIHPGDSRSASVFLIQDERLAKIATTVAEAFPKQKQEVFSVDYHTRRPREVEERTAKTATWLSLEQVAIVDSPNGTSDYACVFNEAGEFLAAGYRNQEHLIVSTALDIIRSIPSPDKYFDESMLDIVRRREIQYTDDYVRPTKSDGVTVSWSDDHTELQALSKKTGTWSYFKIPEEELIAPTVVGNMVSVQLESGVVAYSAETGTWDMLDVPRTQRERTSTDSDYVRVMVGKGNKFYTFPMNSGRWTSTFDPNYRIETTKIQMDNSRASELIKDANRLRVDTMVSVEGIELTGAHVRVEKLLNKYQKAEPSALETTAKSSQFSMRLEWQKDTKPSEGASKDRMDSLLPLQAEAALLSDRYGPNHPKVLALQQRIELTRKKYQRLGTVTYTAGSDSNADLNSQIRSLIEEVFDIRLAAQKQTADKLEQKLKQIREAIRQRESKREQLIEQRLKELQGATQKTPADLGDNVQPQ